MQENISLVDTHPVPAAPPPEVSCRTKFLNFFLKYYLPISYVFFVIFGALVPEPGAFIDHKATNYVCVIGIFIISGLYLRTSDIKDVVTSYKAAIYGLIAILGVTPIIGGQLTSLLDYSTSQMNSTLVGNQTVMNTDVSGFGPLEFKFGIILFLCMPCTIASGIVMVSSLNGHVALAIFFAVFSNIIGIFTVPLYIKWMIASTVNVKIDLPSLMLRLTLTLLLPLVVGKLIRCNKRIRQFITPHKPKSKILSTTLLDIIVWAKVSRTSQSGLFALISVQSAFFVVGWILAIHISYLLLNTFMSWALRMTLAQRKAVILLGSQKTLAVAIPVVTFLPDALGDKGTMVVAMIIGQISMIVFDSILVGVWMHVETKRKQKKENNEDEEKVHGSA